MKRVQEYCIDLRRERQNIHMPKGAEVLAFHVYTDDERLEWPKVLVLVDAAETELEARSFVIVLGSKPTEGLAAANYLGTCRRGVALQPQHIFVLGEKA